MLTIFVSQLTLYRNTSSLQEKKYKLYIKYNQANF